MHLLKPFLFSRLNGPCFARYMATAVAAKPKAKTAFMMMNMGGPSTTDQVHDFLHRLFTDRDIMKLPAQSYLGPFIARRRTPSIQQKYEEIGGGSPILKWTEAQGKLMCERLDKESPETGPHAFYVGFRYTPPLTEDTLDRMLADGIQHAVAFSQYPQYSCATSGSSFNAISQHLKDKPNANNLKWSVIDRWCTSELLAKTFATLIRGELEKVPEEVRKDVVLLFTAHSLPMKAVERGDPYPAEVGATVQLVMKELNFSHPYRLVWQSKVGPVPWLSPATDAAIEAYVKRGRKNLMLIPIAFTSDHIETLHELDIEYIRDLGAKVGAGTILRCPAPNDHPLFIDALVDVAKSHLARVKKGQSIPAQYLLRCPMCENENCGLARKFFKEHALKA